MTDHCVIAVISAVVTSAIVRVRVGVDLADVARVIQNNKYVRMKVSQYTLLINVEL